MSDSDRNDLVYCRAAGQCFQLVKQLRESVKELLELAAPDSAAHDFVIRKANVNLKLSDFADKEFREVYFHDEYPQQDRTLSSGKVKTATGYVVEPTTEDISEYAGDLPGNF